MQTIIDLDCVYVYYTPVLTIQYYEVTMRRFTKSKLSCSILNVSMHCTCDSLKGVL